MGSKASQKKWRDSHTVYRSVKYKAIGYLRKHNQIQFKPGDPIEIIAIDHTSDDTEGWQTVEESMKSTPSSIHIRGYYVGEDEHTVKVAFTKCDDSYSTIFNITKGAIRKIK